MGYFAIVKLEDDNSPDVWRAVGRAEKVLVDAMHYLKKKDGKESMIKELGRFLAKDFEEFERFLKYG